MLMAKGENRVRPYKDTALMAFGIPFVAICTTFIGTDHDLTDTNSLRQFLLKLGYNLCVVLLCWTIIRQMIIFVDRKMPWRKDKALYRIFLQTPLVIMGMSIGYFGATYFRTILFDFWPIDWSVVWLIDYPLAILFLFLINFLYFYLWQQHDRSSVEVGKAKATRVKIKVVKGRATVLLDPEEISCAFRAGEINYIRDASGNTYLWEASLASLAKKLPHFFRLNRQCVVSRGVIKNYTVQNNRNLRVELTGQAGKPQEVNKNRAAAFRRWLEQA